jgi:hypothetical protein
MLFANEIPITHVNFHLGVMIFMATSTVLKKLSMAAAGAAVLALGSAFATTQSAEAAAMRSGFNSSTLPANDDSSTGSVNIGFDVNFFGVNFSSLFVNNNGNVTLDAPLSTFTPFNIVTTGRQIIAPFFADVDTRGAGSAQVTYGTGTVDGRQAFGVNWDNVGYFSFGTDRLNSFQLVLVDRSDIGAGEFDMEFNYDQIQWETGSASGGSGGLGGSSARAGYSNGTDVSYEFPGSAVNGALLDGGPNALISSSPNSDVAGRYNFFVRDGVPQPPESVPEPASVLGLMAVSALGVTSKLKRKQGQKA